MTLFCVFRFVFAKINISCLSALRKSDDFCVMVQNFSTFLGKSGDFSGIVLKFWVVFRKIGRKIGLSVENLEFWICGKMQVI